ncbi:hypothetical protein [Nitratidesulfovibrio sp.]|uniref:hypothetical protein n=1 Tax=Nitratidesulfovibrio sp. TaxID=2802297 RepID=UPI00333EF124
MPGIFITRGMTVAVPSGGLTIGIGDDGNFTSKVTLHVRFDVCPTWTEISLRHLQEAKAKRVDRDIAWSGTDEEQKAATLEREFEASMQAIMAAAIAIDAFYSLVQTNVALPSSLVERWRTKRTPRYSQVAEVLRQAFSLRSKGVSTLRQNLKVIYRLRDLAVHPSGKIEAPLLHPELNVGVEWRFAYFCAHNAEQIFNAATWILWDLAHGGKPNDRKISEYMIALRNRLAEMFPDGHPNVSSAMYLRKP